MTFSVAAALDAYVEKREIIHEADGAWHPSGLFGCARQAVYRIRDTEQTEPIDARTKRVFFVGHRWHEIVQAAVAEYADEVYTEVPVEIPALNLRGSADQLVRFGDRWELQEFKTMNSKAFSYQDLPKPDHVKQASVYLLGLRLHGCPEMGIPPLGDALDRIRLTYISKDDLRIEECLVPESSDPDLLEMLLDNVIATVEEVEPYRLDPDSLPPRLPLVKGKRAWNCNYCSWATRCWESDPDEIAPAGADF